MLTIFLSYSVEDGDLLLQLAETVRSCGCEVRCWEESKKLGEEVWPGIFEWISQCDLVLAIITDKTVKRAMSVGQEIGHARALGKKVIPLVGPGVAASELGCLQGVVHKRIDPDNLAASLVEIKAILRKEVRREEFWNALTAVGAVVGVLAICCLVDSTPPKARSPQP